MKRRFYLLFLVPLLLILASCEKDGNPQDRMKIEEIYAEKEVLYNDVHQYTLSNRLVEKWCWDGNTLSRIDYCEDMATYSENFYYNGRNQIVSSTVPAYGLRSEMSYDGRKLSEISVYLDDQLAYVYRFYYEGKQLIRLELSQESPVADKACPLISRMHSLHPFSNLLSPKSTTSQTLDFTWDDDNLIAAILSSGQSIPVHYAFDYDDGNNPYYDLLSLYTFDGGMRSPYLFSKNNIVSILCNEDDLNGLTTFAYQYGAHDYPTNIVVRHSHQALDEQGDWGEMTITEVETRTIKYL